MLEVYYRHYLFACDYYRHMRNCLGESYSTNNQIKSNLQLTHLLAFTWWGKSRRDVASFDQFQSRLTSVNICIRLVQKNVNNKKLVVQDILKVDDILLKYTIFCLSGYIVAERYICRSEFLSGLKNYIAGMGKLVGIILSSLEAMP